MTVPLTQSPAHPLVSFECKGQAVQWISGPGADDEAVELELLREVVQASWCAGLLADLTWRECFGPQGSVPKVADAEQSWSATEHWGSHSPDEVAVELGA